MRNVSNVFSSNVSHAVYFGFRMRRWCIRARIWIIVWITKWITSLHLLIMINFPLFSCCEEKPWKWWNVFVLRKAVSRMLHQLVRRCEGPHGRQKEKVYRQRRLVNYKDLWQTWQFTFVKELQKTCERLMIFVNPLNNSFSDFLLCYKCQRILWLYVLIISYLIYLILGLLANFNCDGLFTNKYVCIYMYMRLSGKLDYARF